MALENLTAAEVELYKEVKAKLGLNVRLGVLGKSLTTYNIGGPLQFFVEPDNRDQLQELFKILSSAGAKFRVLGAGSNLLIADKGLSGWVIRLGPGFRYLNSIDAQHFEVGASMSLMSLCRNMSGQGLSGLEFAGGIPASIGGAVRMNAGAHHGEICSVIKDLEVLTPEGEFRNYKGTEIEWSYRHSGLEQGLVVTSVRIALVPGDSEAIKQKMIDCLQERKRRQPLSLPSAGSVFKNPNKEQSAGYLIEQCGLKGRQSGGAQISDMHANWIVNPGRLATAKEVKDLISICQHEVRQRFSIELKPEVVRWD